MLKNYWPTWRRLLFAQSVFMGMPFGLVFCRYKGRTWITREVTGIFPIAMTGNGATLTYCLVTIPHHLRVGDEPANYDGASIRSNWKWPWIKDNETGLRVKG